MVRRRGWPPAHRPLLPGGWDKRYKPPHPAIAGISVTSVSPYPAVSALLQAVSDSPVLSHIYDLPFPSLLSGSVSSMPEIKTAKPWGVKSAHDTAKPKTELAINFIISTPSNLATRRKKKKKTSLLPSLNNYLRWRYQINSLIVDGARGGGWCKAGFLDKWTASKYQNVPKISFPKMFDTIKKCYQLGEFFKFDHLDVFLITVTMGNTNWQGN